MICFGALARHVLSWCVGAPGFVSVRLRAMTYFAALYASVRTSVRPSVKSRSSDPGKFLKDGVDGLD